MSSPYGYDIDDGINIAAEFGLIQSSSFLSCAAWAAFMYDLVTTLDDEFAFVWGNKMNVGSFFYVLTRYLTVGCLCFDIIRVIILDEFHVGPAGAELQSQPLLDIPFEVSPPIASYYMGIVIMFSSMILLQLRACALYGSRKALLIVFCTIDLLVMGSFIYLGILDAEVGIFPSSFIWIPFVVLETVTFTLGLWKSYTTYRHHHGIPVWWSPLLKILVRDNMVYYLIILLFYMFGIFMNFFTSSEDVRPAVYFYNAHFMSSVAFSGFAAPKLFINMKKSYLNPTLSVGGHTITPIRFQAVPRAQSSTLTGNSSRVEEYSMGTIG